MPVANKFKMYSLTLIDDRDGCSNVDSVSANSDYLESRAAVRFEEYKKTVGIPSDVKLYNIPRDCGMISLCYKDAVYDDIPFANIVLVDLIDCVQI